MIEAFDDPNNNFELNSTLSGIVNDDAEVSLLKSSQDIVKMDDSIDKVSKNVRSK